MVLQKVAEAIGKGVTLIFGARNDRLIKEMLPIVEAINELEPGLEKLSDVALGEKTQDLKKRINEQLEAQGGFDLLDDARTLRQDTRTAEAIELEKKYREIEQKILDGILPEAFALVREAGKRTLGQRHYDVQMLGGIVLHRGCIAEMVTGEGKTLVATLPAYLNALPGRGVHVVTVNDYLARRDRDWNAPLFALLGLTVGVIQSDMGNDERKIAYDCDITYGTNNEYGFDYLRDNMKVDVESQVQRPLNFAIIDEVDSILIDEARTPLIISGDAMEHTDAYYTADDIARKLKGVDKNKIDLEAKQRGVELEDLAEQWDYYFSEKDHQIVLTERGIEKAEKLLGKGSIYEGKNMEWPHLIEQALRAHALYTKDVQYVVEPEDGRMAVIIVDEFTGRKMHGRTWSDGLHQAIESKEGLKIKQETQTLATITLQNYFRLYKKNSGMTGTAATQKTEFWEVYKLDVVTMPTNRPLNRKNFPDVVYKTTKEKYKAICGEIEAVHAMGRPILVGTVSIENSEKIADMLKRRGIEHEVLNAKHHEREAQIVAKAGQLGHVTIATNMAGRGTDIILGQFSDKELLDHWKASGAAPKDLELGDPAFYDKLGEHWASKKLMSGHTLLDEWKWREVAQTFEANGKKREGVKLCSRVQDLGGLHIIGTERHEARRIDNQLRGRCGRQGDPGSSRFYLCLEDDLMRIFASDRVAWLLEKLGMEEDQEISHGMVTRSIEKAQTKVEDHHFDIRKNLLEYDQVMDEQRKLVYGERQRILDCHGKSGDAADTILGQAQELGSEGDSANNTVDGQLWWKVESHAGAWDVSFYKDEKLVSPVAKATGVKPTERFIAAPQNSSGITIHWRLGEKPEDKAEGTLDLGYRTLRNAVFRWIEVTLDKALKQWVSDDVSTSEHDPAALADWIRSKFDLKVDPTTIAEKKEEDVSADLIEKIRAAHTEREKEIGAGEMKRLERFLLLQKIDEKWKDHLHGMDQLRSGIGYRSYAQLDPKVAYKKEGYELFQEMWENIADEVTDLLFKVRPIKREEEEALLGNVWKPTEFVKPAEVAEQFHEKAAETERQAYAASQQGPDGEAANRKPIEREEPKVGRNDPCPCGSGKKYKKCHGATAAAG